MLGPKYYGERVGGTACTDTTYELRSTRSECAANGVILSITLFSHSDSCVCDTLDVLVREAELCENMYAICVLIVAVMGSNTTTLAPGHYTKVSIHVNFHCAFI